MKRKVWAAIRRRRRRVTNTQEKLIRYSDVASRLLVALNLCVIQLPSGKVENLEQRREGQAGPMMSLGG